MDKLDAMQVLLAVVDSGSLSAGSRKLNAALPSVSRKVAELERHLGTRLLIRTSRNIQLTDAGREYVEAARAIITQIDDAERRAGGEYDCPRGELSITMPIEFGRVVGMPICAAFLAEHPQINLNIIATDRALQLLEEQVDIAIRMGNLADSSLVAIKVGDVGLVTVASPAYLERCGEPEHPEDLLNHDAAVFGQLEQIWANYGSDGERYDVQPRQRVRVNTASASVAVALNGAALARTLVSQVAEYLQSGALVRVMRDYSAPSIPVHLVYAKQGLMPLKVRAFLDFAAPRLRQKLQEYKDMCQRSTATLTVADKPGRSLAASG
jgi:DNA-binding transcriptional LysR family regulator